MRVLICGGRHWLNRESIRSQLISLQSQGYDTVIEGEARGADTLAREEAEKLGMIVEKYPAKWSIYGKAAGPIRNKQMLDGNPDLVVAFHSDLAKSTGTADTVAQARKRGIEVVLVSK